MNHEVIDENLKEFIKRRAIRNGIKEDECVVRYAGHMYLVNLKENKVFVMGVEFK